MSTEPNNTPLPEENPSTPETAEATAAEPRPKKVKTAAEKAIRLQHSRDGHERERLKQSQREIRKGIRNALENWGATDEETKPAAKRLLESRGIPPGYFLDKVYELGLAAALAHRIPANCFYWTNGLQATLQSIACGSAVLAETIDPTAEDVPGELVDPAALYALWDFAEAGRADSLTFEQWLELRYNIKTDFFTLSEIEDKDFVELPHRRFVELMPKLDPRKLKRNYTQRDMQNFLADSNDGFKQRLLISSRNSLKSSFVILWCVQALLICPDLRLLLLTETHPLSTLFLRSLRNYLVVRGVPSRLQAAFPEACIDSGAGNDTSFRMPNARLELVQGVQASSFSAKGFAGSRFDFAVCDDPSSEESISPDAIQNTIDKYDAIGKLSEIKSLGSIVVMTPWSQTPPDLGAELLRRNEEVEDKFLLYHIEPAFEIRPSGAAKFAANDLLALEESDVVLTYPTRLTWSWIRDEMVKSKSNGYRFFRSQNLCQWLPPQDAELRCTFIEKDVREHIKPLSFFEPYEIIDTVASLDVAYAQNKFADFSCLCVANILNKDNTNIFLNSNMMMGRWTISMIGEKVADMTQATPGLSRIVCERNGPWQQVRDSIYNACRRRGFDPPYLIFRATNFGGTSMKTKTARIKALELALFEGTLYWTPGPPDLEQGLAQLISFDGISKSSRKKNDYPDALSLAYETFYPRAMDAQQAKELNTQEDAIQNARNVQAIHAHIFDAPSIRQAPEPPSPRRPQPWDVFNSGVGNAAGSPLKYHNFGAIHRAKRGS